MSGWVAYFPAHPPTPRCVFLPTFRVFSSILFHLISLALACNEIYSQENRDSAILIQYTQRFISFHLLNCKNNWCNRRKTILSFFFFFISFCTVTYLQKIFSLKKKRTLQFPILIDKYFYFGKRNIIRRTTAY